MTAPATAPRARALPPRAQPPRAGGAGATTPCVTPLVAGAPVDPGAEGRRPLRWWREVLVVLAFYGAYSWVRGRFGSGAAGPDAAFANARAVLAVEQRLGLPSELGLQRWFLAFPAAVRALNVFYGLFHFAFPVTVLVVLARRAPRTYRRARNALAATTALALVGFALFPLMPPRLLCACAGGAGTDYGYVDTLERIGGLWTFGSHGMSAVSNQYAAMPSLHFAWALWCALALRPVVRGRIGRTLLVAYPALTLLAIVVTANHFWLDAAGGAAIVVAGFGVAAVLPMWAGTPAGRRASTPGRLPVLVPGPGPVPALATAGAATSLPTPRHRRVVGQDRVTVMVVEPHQAIP